MNAKELIDAIRSSPDDYALRLLTNALEHFWSKGYTACIIDQNKLAGFSHRNRLRLEDDIEIVRDRLIQQGLRGQELEDAIKDFLLFDNE